MIAFFVTGTGTDVGKTYIGAGLLDELKRRNMPVRALKPVVSGFDAANPEGSDPYVLMEAAGMATSELERVSPWRFTAPLSPDMAARREGRAVDFEALVKFCRTAVNETEGALLIEGVGGVMAPLDDKHTVLDWMSAQRLPLVMVAGSYLGALSHTLTALDTVSRRNLEVAALVVNQSEGSGVPLVETMDTLSRFCGRVPLISVPRQGDAAAFAKLADLLSET